MCCLRILECLFDSSVPRGVQPVDIVHCDPIIYVDCNVTLALSDNFCNFRIFNNYKEDS